MKPFVLIVIAAALLGAQTVRTAQEKPGPGIASDTTAVPAKSGDAGTPCCKDPKTCKEKCRKAAAKKEKECIRMHQSADSLKADCPHHKAEVH